MNAYLIQTANPEAYNAADYRALVVTGKSGTDTVLDILHTENPTKAGDKLIGAWDRSGAPVETIDLAAYEAIRPLGNYSARTGNPPIPDTRGGEATRHLLYPQYAGWAQRQLNGGGRLYPRSNEPFWIETRNKEFTGQWAGHGWRAEFVGEAEARDPTARVIAWYSDPECTQYVDKSDAFQRGPSDWQIDDKGQPFDVWFSETPPGFAKAQPEPWHLAVLHGSLQEGYATLEPDSQGIKRLYWEHQQPSISAKRKSR